MREDELAGFIKAAIRSVWALELLKLLRQDPDRRWTVASLVSELRASTALVGEVLQDFTAAGLVQAEGDEYRYAPASPVIAELCDQLDNAYRERPVSVINMVTRAPKDNLRTFADAFRLKDT